MTRQKKSDNKKLFLFFFIVISLYYLTLLFYGSTLPYVGYNAWNFNTYSLIAHNYNLFGMFATKFAQIVSVSRELPAIPQYYLNHPPLLSLLIASVFRLFGESFFTGRLVNIAAAFFSGTLLLAIGTELKGRSYGLIVFALAASLPAMSIFGKMIGQESLVLFFALLCLYSFFQYAKKKNSLWLLLSILSTICGVLTDWAMAYFSLIFSFYLFHAKQRKVAIFFLAAGLVTSLCYLFYVQNILGSIDFLYEGFLNRSVGELLRRNNWEIIWMSTLGTRLLFYFNPLLLLFVIFYFVSHKKITHKNEFFLILSLLGFGLLHIFLYPEGSYGHPYWLYYLIPGIIFSGAFGVEYLLNKKRVLFTVVMLFLFLYSLILQIWKTKEIEGNVFRYKLAALASSLVPKGGVLILNREGVIDADIFNYSFHHPTKILEKNQQIGEKGIFSGVIYSCIPLCSQDDEQLQFLRNVYSATRLRGDKVEMWVFVKRKGKSYVEKRINIGLPSPSDSVFSVLYRSTMHLLSIPQL